MCQNLRQNNNDKAFKCENFPTLLTVSTEKVLQAMPFFSFHPLPKFICLKVISRVQLDLSVKMKTKEKGKIR